MEPEGNAFLYASNGTLAAGGPLFYISLLTQEKIKSNWTPSKTCEGTSSFRNLNQKKTFAKA